MENLLAQVPELKLMKRVEKRTTHRKDIEEAVFLKNIVGNEGEVVNYEFWVDDNGYQWTRPDVLRYIKVNNLLDVSNEIINDVKKAQEAQNILQPVTMN